MSAQFFGGQVPLLEYDADVRDFVGDGHRAAEAGNDPVLPRRIVLAFLGDVVQKFAAAQGWQVGFEFDLIAGVVPMWVGEYQGEQLALVNMPVGAAASVTVAERAVMLGVDTLVAVGSCGSLVPHEAGALILPTKALRDEGTSYHYLPAGRWVETDAQVRAACGEAIEGLGLEFVEAATWTTDGFFRETPGKVAARRGQGCEVVEMECSALSAMAQFRGVRFGQILYSADSLAAEVHDQRGWGSSFREIALNAALDAAIKL
ncbi:nucleoside phosphorylase [Dermatophilus congolensis]|uniref:nucleoside phosphorylase n=1 Tax=Dermatophilus congolensis TaxID=1863 RepID=UPI001AAF1345|nr:nucleoside phosphorylase [Dermatophilus congolensis]MBO3142313.1 nucleoside phosphorylase [Dermatophilus congolensis]MBO3151304.1 nucleoside phosphorylase [Dermatophilus congolensis]MBO3161692.1 nucleoside phosphorylase [Dermatophilus congolensis]MBO3162590.1 nucleoside phosphorylase [Dermatophilus congolensis]MBO3176143.1 nucleoside phosphorylase [Dermatophilus congolensis]